MNVLTPPGFGPSFFRGIDIQLRLAPVFGVKSTRRRRSNLDNMELSDSVRFNNSKFRFNNSKFCSLRPDSVGISPMLMMFEIRHQLKQLHSVSSASETERCCYSIALLDVDLHVEALACSGFSV